MTQTEALLNVLWVLVCVTGLSVHFWRSRHSQGTQTGAGRLRRTLSVLIAAVALFPCISASDDRLRLGSVDTLPVTDLAFDRTHLASPVTPILEDPEHGQAVAPLLISFVIAFIVMVGVETPRLKRWFPLSSLGRAPPPVAWRTA